MPSKKEDVNPFRAPGLKYAGRVEVGGGPVPLQKMHRPYVPAERDRPLGAEGKDLRGERKQKQTQPPASTKRNSKS